MVAIKRMQSPHTALPRPFATPALTGLTEDEILDRLTVEHLSRAAYWRLWEGAMADNSAVRRGLRHDDPRVSVLPAWRFSTTSSMTPPSPRSSTAWTTTTRRVRGWALHTLGCDRCKEGTCRPGEDLFMPAAIRMLREDPDPSVRAAAATTLGQSAAIRRSDVAHALATARDGDPDRHVRKTAARFATP